MFCCLELGVPGCPYPSSFAVTIRMRSYNGRDQKHSGARCVLFGPGFPKCSKGQPQERAYQQVLTSLATHPSAQVESERQV